MRVGEALKRGGTEKRERETKMLKRRWGKLGQEVGALKRRGGGGVLEPPYIPCQK